MNPSQHNKLSVALIPTLLLACLSLCLVPIASAQSSLTNGLVAHYPFDGNANDVSGNGNNGIVYGAISGFDRYGFPNGSFKFTGTTNRIRLNIGPSTFVGDYAISLWANVTDLQAGSLGLVSGDQGCVRFYVLGSGYGADAGKVGFYMFQPDPWTQVGLMTSGSYLTTNRWHHLAVVRSGGNFLMYVDGALSTQTTGGSLPLNGTYLEVGNDLTNVSSLHGNLDELRIYSRALSPIEIESLAREGADCTPPSSGLVAWWPGDGNASDIQGTNNGALINGPAFSSGKVGQAFQFNGGNYVQIQGNEALSPTNISVEGWFNVASQNAGPALVGTYYGGTPQAPAPATGWSLLISSGLRPDFTLARGATSVAVISAVPITLNTWAHIAATYDGTNARIFVNGALQDTAAFPGGYTPSSAPMLIGAASWCESYGCSGYDFHLNGYVDELSIHDRALTAAEIHAIYVAGSEGKCKPCLPNPPGLAAWWPADGNADDVQGPNNGTLINGATFASGKVGQAFSFDGIGSCVSIEYSPSLSSLANYSVTAWVNPSTTFSSQVLLFGQSHARSQLVIVPGNKVTYQFGTGSSFPQVTSLTSLPPGEFSHVAGTWDGNALKIYVNGVLENQASVTGVAPLNGTCRYWIGGFSEQGGNCGDSHQFFQGLIDEVAFYPRALAPNEIATIHAAGSAGMCKDAPSIRMQPVSQFVVYGTNVTLAVSASGLPPLFYQWRFNSTNLLAGQTNSTLIISNVQPNNVGIYSVAVSNSVGSVLSSNAILTVLIPDGDQDSDGLLNEQETLFGTNPLNSDTDDDGLSDYDELFVHGTNPVLSDSDGGGIPDGWEVQHGLNPRFNDTADDLDGDGLSNFAEFIWSTNHPGQLVDPRKKYSTSATMSDFAVVTGAGTNQFFYDRNDRLVGAEYDRGLSLAYVYDRNGNLTRQVSMLHDANANGLPDVWEFLNGLTNNANAYTDTDGDSWSDRQEWQSGTNPRNPNSAPNLLGNPGTQIASLQHAFTPSSFVVGVGQLDGVGAQEIVLGADGDPGTNVNFLLVLTQGATTWSTQRVDVGSFRITSIAVGNVTNRPSAAIYVGLRGTTNGSGRVLEFLNSGGVWQSTLVALATNEAAFVLGVRGQDLLVSLATTNAPDGSLSAVSFTTNWSLSLIDTNTSHRGLGMTASLTGIRQSALRLIDAGGIQVGVTLPASLGAAYRSEFDSWYALTPGPMTWSNAQNLAQSYQGNLVTIEGAAENSWVRSLSPNTNLWLGLTRNPGSAYNDPSSWKWISKSTAAYRYWNSGEPNDVGDIYGFAVMPNGILGWADDAATQPYYGVIEIKGPAASLVEPSATRTNNWRGSSLASGFLRTTNGSSVFYAFADDKNTNGLIDLGDDFVTAEYLMNGTNTSPLAVSRQSISSLTPAQSYGLASVNFLNASNEVFFTGGPDGQVFAWTASGATNPLQRRLFSGHHTGKAWHALAGVKTLDAGEALIGLRVDHSAPNQCDVILWSPQSQLPALANLPNTPPAAAVLPSAGPLGGQAAVTVRLWDAEGNAATPFLQYQISGTTNWQDAKLVGLNGAPYSVTTRVAASPAGDSYTVVWNALASLEANTVTNVLLRARARDMTSLGDWSVGTPFQVDTSQADNDGMDDSWELLYFGTTSRPGSGDFDGDGFTDLQEFIADTNPTDATSHLRMTGVLEILDGLWIQWQGGVQATQYLQRLTDLNTNFWQNIATSLPPTPISGSYTDAPGTNAIQFYRIKATR